MNILKVVEDGDLERVKKLVRDNSYSENYEVLPLAIKHGHLGIVKLLVDHGCDTSSAVYEAYKYGQVKIIKVLITMGADLSTIANQSVLRSAIMKKDSETIELLCKHQISVTASEWIIASTYGMIGHILQYTLPNKAVQTQMKDQGFRNSTLFEYACCYGDIDHINWLIYSNTVSKPAMFYCIKSKNIDKFKVVFKKFIAEDIDCVKNIGFIWEKLMYIIINYGTLDMIDYLPAEKINLERYKIIAAIPDRQAMAGIHKLICKGMPSPDKYIMTGIYKMCPQFIPEFMNARPDITDQKN